MFSVAVYTVEFQKRGLPHAHIVLWLADEDKLKTPEDIDEVICAEIPDEETDTIGYRAVSQLMMHGPCGEANPKCPCMFRGRCGKHFPKPFSNSTTINNDGYALYRRRNTQRTVKCNNIYLDNRFAITLSGLVSSMQSLSDHVISRLYAHYCAHAFVTAGMLFLTIVGCLSNTKDTLMSKGVIVPNR